MRHHMTDIRGYVVNVGGETTFRLVWLNVHTPCEIDRLNQLS
jgi:hypothetical protein